MKSTEIIEIVTDAVVDAVKAQLGQEIAQAVKAALGPVLQGIERDRRLFETTIEDKITRLCAAHAETRASFEAVREAHTHLAAMTAELTARAPPERGPPGERGAPGDAGRPGRDGRDATFATVRAWRAGSATEAGACVTHKAGLWLALADTDAEPGTEASGFSLVLDGSLPLECLPDERGYLQLIYEHASGKRSAIPMHMRPLQYAGLYEASRAYEPNDLVTVAGSLWLARTATRDAQPGTDAGAAAWLLIVKRGKDGKDGGPGPRGEPGQRGERGPPGERGAAAPAPARRGSNGASP